MKKTSQEIIMSVNTYLTLLKEARHHIHQRIEALEQERKDFIVSTIIYSIAIIIMTSIAIIVMINVV